MPLIICQQDEAPPATPTLTPSPGNEDFVALLEDYMRAAYLNAQKSNDPSTQNGGVFVVGHRVVGNGHNQAPPATGLSLAEVEEQYGKAAKYMSALHAEEDTINDARRRGARPGDGMLIVPWAACAECAKHMIEARIMCLVRHHQAIQTYRDNAIQYPENRHDWYSSVQWADFMLTRAGIKIFELDCQLGEEYAIRNGTHRWVP